MEPRDCSSATIPRSNDWPWRITSERRDSRSTRPATELPPLQFLKNRNVDLLLLDLQMPGLSGFDVLNYVYEHRRSLPVILLSGMPPDEIQEQIHSLNERELPPLFIKPVNPEQLVEMVEIQLSGELPHS
jgi:DNA-binding response OmpR family regulator